MRKAVTFVALALVLALCVSPGYANEEVPPVLPHAFYGTVTISGAEAPDGTRVSATVDDGEVITNVQNPTTTDGGSYGVGDSPYLLVQGNITPGATITFYVDGVEAEGQTDTFEVGGGPTEMDLLVTRAAPAPGPGLAPAHYYIEAELFGEEFSFSISDEGEILETIEATSADGMLTLTIPDGTIALDEYGDPLESLEIDVDPSPPDPPEDAHIIGLAYDFGPDGATFDPHITMTYTLDLDDLPEGVAPEDLVIAYWDGDEWVELDSEVDIENSTITVIADVEHFTTFAVIGAVTPPEEEEIVPPEEEEEIVPPEEEEVVLPPEEEVVPPEEVVPAKPPVNWPVIGSIIGGVIVAGLLIFFLVRRRRAA